MAPENEAVYRANSKTEDPISKPTFKDADKALDFLRTEAEVGEIDLIDEAQLVRKIDFMIVPIMFGCYCLQYLDKSLLNYASVMGLLEDADLTTEQYGTLSLIFYVAFLAFEMPHAYMMVSGLADCLWRVVVGTMLTFVLTATLPNGEVSRVHGMLLGYCRGLYIGLQLVRIPGSDEILARHVRVLHQSVVDPDHIHVVSHEPQ